MPARKRTHDEVDKESIAPAPPSLLDRIRNSWEFACLMQYIFLFGQAVKIDKDLDVEILEEECIRPGNSEVLTDIGLALLKYVSSHKGLTPEIFDEYARRQFVAKAPGRNPFGIDEEPRHFTEFDIFTKLRVLHQLSVWTLNNPDRIREKMEEKEGEQTQWRMEPLGWDAEERSYFVLDDDRLYRRTDPPPPPPPAPKAKPKPKLRRTKGRRTSKRQKLSEPDDVSMDEDEETLTPTVDAKEEEVDDGLGGAKWECLAVSLAEYNTFLETIRKSRQPDEKVVFRRITEEVLPVIEKRAESQERKASQRRRELENLERLATAKRSSRLAGKQEKLKELQVAEEAERKRKDDLAMAKREQDRQQKLEEARESRMMTREQRLKDREVKRILHEEELARLRSSSEEGSQAGARISERSRKLELEKTQKELEKLNEDEEDWYFDCAVCGTHGKNLDDGTHSIACERCNVWQHSACHGIKEGEAESDDFHFVCASCKKPKVTSLKLRLGPSSSPQEEKHHVNGINEVQPSHTNGIHPEARISTDPAYAPKALPLPDNHTAVPIHDEEDQPDRYLAKSQGKFSPSAMPNGYSALAAHSTATAPITKNELLVNGISSQETPATLEHHNPYLNHFNRQRTTPSQQERHPPASFSPLPPNMSTPAAQTTTTATRTPFLVPYPTPRPTDLANSPTPSLSATQGNTNVRFSASPKAAGSPRSSSYIPVSATTAKQQPTIPAALSPTKSSPPQIRTSPNFAQTGNGMAPPFGLATPAATSGTGLSPVKSNIPASLDGAMDVISPHQQTSYVRPVSPTDAAPLLSPTVDANQRHLQPPVKKATPMKGDVERDGWMQVSSTPAPRPLDLGMSGDGT